MYTKEELKRAMAEVLFHTLSEQDCLMKQYETTTDNERLRIISHRLVENKSKITTLKNMLL